MLKAVGLIILVYFLAMALNFINVNHTHIPSIPGTGTASNQQAGSN